MKHVGRYVLSDEIASGGMATVHLARLMGDGSFSRVVAAKILHAQYAKEEGFRAMFLDEARIVSRIRHPNVVATLDVQEDHGELFLFMEYVHGESLSKLARLASAAGERIPLPIVSGVIVDTLEGLHAAHEATSERGAALHIVHRDVSPQNILVGCDGVAKVADFGVAKAVGRLAEKFSSQHAVKGKAGYMAPEQVRGTSDHRADVYAAGVVLWEALAGRRLFTGESVFEIMARALDARVAPPSSVRPEVSPALDAVVLRAVDRDPSRRYATARDMAIALEERAPRASAREIGEWVRRTARASLEARAEQISRIERDDTSRATVPDLVAPPQEADTLPAAARAPEAPADTISGLAQRSAPRALRPRWLAGPVAAVVLAGVAAAALVRSSSATPREPMPAAAIAEPAPPASTSAAPEATVEPAPEPPREASSARPAPARPARASTAAPPARAGSVRAAASDPSRCHWVELPDPQGILIPKKVCP